MGPESEGLNIGDSDITDALEEQEEIHSDNNEALKLDVKNTELNQNKELLPEEKNEIPEELKGVKPEEVISVAREAWPGIMKEVRNERGQTPVGEHFGYFTLPFMGEKDRSMPLVYLPTVGCLHAIEGGCTMCDYGIGKGLSIEALEKAAMDALSFIESTNKGHDLAIYNINALGSFFDEREIPADVRSKIFERIANTKDGHKEVLLSTESRLEFINEDKIKDMKKILGDDVKVEIGVGFESGNPIVREGAINKSFPKNFKEKFAMLKENGVDVIGHVMLKPPFLTEKEAINDTVSSIKYLFDNNLVDIAIAMTMNVKKNTLVGKLEEEGKYELPNLWSVVEVMKELGPDFCEKTRFFGFETSEASKETGVKTVRGCSDCSEAVFSKILKFSGSEKEYNEIMDSAEKTNCNCKSDWQKSMQIEPKSTLVERIATGLDQLGKEYLGKGFNDLKDEKKITEAKKKLK